MPMTDSKGNPLWDMPAPIRYAEHTRWRRHKRTGERIAEPVQVPVYRGTSASYARWVKAQIRRNMRKQEEARKAAEEQAAEAAEDTQEALTDLVLNPGGFDVEAEQFEAE